MRTLLRRLLITALCLGGVYAVLSLVVTVRSGGSYELVLADGQGAGVYVPFVRRDGLNDPGAVWALLQGGDRATASAPSRAKASWEVDERDGVENAWMAAHRILGRHLDVTRSLVIEEVDPHSAAEGVGLAAGMRIETIDGRDGSLQSLLTAVWNSALVVPHPQIELSLARGRIVRVPVSEDALGHPVIDGLHVTEQNRVADAPPVVLRPARMSGESFGLGAALVFTARLTGQDGYGVRVAASGVIYEDGAVGEVLGIREKMEAVNRLRAEVVLVPKANVEEARLYLDEGIALVGVETLDEAVNALCSLGRCSAELTERP